MGDVEHSYNYIELLCVLYFCISGHNTDLNYKREFPSASWFEDTDYAKYILILALSVLMDYWYTVM